MKRIIVSWNELKTQDLALLKRAVYYGDGFFETIRWQNSRPLLWKHHWQRIKNTAEVLSLPLPYSETEFLHTLQEHIFPCNSDQRIRLSFIRAGEGFYTPQQNKLVIVIESTPLPQNGYVWYKSSCDIGISSFVKLRHSLSTLKLLSAQIYISAAIEAQQKGWNEAVLLNDAGHVCEGISHNLFIVKNGNIITPPLSEGCLQGVMRTHLLSINPNIQQRILLTEDLEEADEIFFTNVITGIRSVTSFNGRALKKELTREIFSAMKHNNLL